MELSTNGLRFIARREGLVLVAYQDGPHKSIGFGHNDPKLKDGDEITAKEAFALLRHDVGSRIAPLTRMLEWSVEQHQFDALLSLYYQSGNRYVPKLAKLINQGNLETAAKQLPDCDRNLAGKQIPGLRKRRLLEQKMFLTGDYGSDLDAIPFWRGNPHKTKPEIYHVQPEDFS